MPLDIAPPRQQTTTAELHYLIRTTAWCMDRRCSRNDPFPKLGLGHADIVRASHLQHAIEGVDRHVNFSRPTFVYT
jgi:hypothetical protein